MEQPVYKRLRIAAKRIFEHETPSWLQTNLPWRLNRTPYKVFISEFLLVRTRHDVVARIFEDFVRKYPTPRDIVDSSIQELHEALFPLGLKKRVPQLKEAANQIMDLFDGQIPNSFGELVKIKGIGDYTACAILVFAFGEKRVPADVNVLRFVSRFTGLPMHNKTKGSKQIVDLLPEIKQYQTKFSAEKLLDFTTGICKPRNPKCDGCILADLCSFPN